MTDLNTIANWLEAAAQSAKRGVTANDEPAFKDLYNKRYAAITAAQAKLREAGSTPLEDFIKKEKGR